MARLRRSWAGVSFGLGISGSGAGGGGGGGRIVGVSIICDSWRGIQGPSASSGGRTTRRVVDTIWNGKIKNRIYHFIDLL